MLNPHLFTHLFHEGVIVSTRKLVYDAGSNEEAIKALMQAQHKAVMKDLRKGTFDEKIDQYLGHLPGLEARASDAGKRQERAATEVDAPQAAAPGTDSAPIEYITPGQSEPIELPVKRPSEGIPVQSRTGTGDRTIPIDTHAKKQPPPPSAEIDAPTVQGGDMAAAVKQANQASRKRSLTPQKVSRTAQPELGRAPTQLAQKTAAAEAHADSSPVIEINVDDDEISERLRGPRDTAVTLHEEPAAPTRPASHGAATLPAMKQPQRPMTPPIVSTRPPTQDRKKQESEAVEIYSPPPAAVEPPPGERAERPGQYSMSRKEGAAPIREKTGRIAAINAPPTASSSPPTQTRRSGSGGNAVVQQPQNARDSGAIPRAGGAAPGSGGVPRQGGAAPGSGGARQQIQRGSQAAITPPVQSRTTTPPAGSRAVPAARATAPIQNRAQSPAPPQPGSGVVMTRPAVIVGAPPKSQTPPQQRVRKAREDEGRGFGQGLISEKSLDEVILAYLSEDAEDK